MCDHDSKATGVAYLAAGNLCTDLICEGCGTKLQAFEHHAYKPRPVWPAEGDTEWRSPPSHPKR